WYVPMRDVENQIAIAGDIMVAANGGSDVAAFRTIRADDDGSDGPGRVDEDVYISPIRFSSDKVEDERHSIESGGFLPESTSTITIAGTIVTEPPGYLTW